MKNVIVAGFVGATLLVASAVHAEPGFLGISIKADTEGFFLNPTLKSVEVASVVAGSPAARAGIVEGDVILAVEGKRVAGARANDLKPYMRSEAGQRVRFLLRKADGEETPVTVVAGPKP